MQDAASHEKAPQKSTQSHYQQPTNVRVLLHFKLPESQTKDEAWYISDPLSWYEKERELKMRNRQALKMRRVCGNLIVKIMYTAFNNKNFLAQILQTHHKYEK